MTQQVDVLVHFDLPDDWPAADIAADVWDILARAFGERFGKPIVDTDVEIVDPAKWKLVPR